MQDDVKQEQAEEVGISEALELLAKLHPRILKLQRAGKKFIVIGEHEPYYLAAYAMIRQQERSQGTWTEEDALLYGAAVRKRQPSMPDEDKQEQAADLFANPRTSLEDIKAAGWKRNYSNTGGGGWWFERMVDGQCERHRPPRWVWELMNESERNAVMGTRMTILSTLGLTATGLDKPVKVSKDADKL